MGLTNERGDLAERLRLEAAGWEAIGSAFYGVLGRLMADDLDRAGPVWDLLAPAASVRYDEAYALRLLGGVHRLVLTGQASDLACHYPTTGGDGDAAGAWPAFIALVASRPAEIVDALTRPPQTNEVGRSASLTPGFLMVAAETRLPLRLLEVGSSAGLNLRVDRYWYEQAGAGWGDPESPVRLVDLWPDAAPPLSVPATIDSRQGCDPDPIDAGDPDRALTLLSYVWPDQHERLALLRAALAVARDVPVRVDRVGVEDWLPERLADPTAGVATVVFHSVVWQYLPEPVRARVLATLADAGRRATPDAPLAYLRLEPSPDAYFPAELRLTTWPGSGVDRLLATSGFHLGRVHWTG